MTAVARESRASRRPPERDMDATPFAAILERLLARVPGAYAAALVDQEGETVDYAGLAGSFDLRVAAAEVRLALDQLGRAMPETPTQWIVVRGAKKTFAARQLPDGYALVTLLRRRAGFTASRRAFAVCERELGEEAGWRSSASSPKRRSARPELLHDRGIAHLEGPWWAVEVEVDGRGRPRRVRTAAGEARAVEVLGAVVGHAPNELGFRVRTPDGEEFTLVREARRCWYADSALR